MPEQDPRLQDLLQDLSLDDGPGPAQPLRPEEARQQVIAALDAVLPAQTLATPAPRRRAWWAVAAAALVFIALPAGAALWSYVRAPRPPPELRPPAPTEAEALTPPPQVPAPQTATVAAPTPTAEARARPARRAARRRPRRTNRPRPAPPAAPSAEQLLNTASRLSGEQQWAAAARAYEALIEAHPGHRATYVARISAGALYLDHLNAPGSAARAYRAALAQRSTGPLHAAARWGLARAYRAQGDQARESKVLRTLLQNHPEALQVRQAKLRLQAIEGSP